MNITPKWYYSHLWTQTYFCRYNIKILGHLLAQPPCEFSYSCATVAYLDNLAYEKQIFEGVGEVPKEYQRHMHCAQDWYKTMRYLYQHYTRSFEFIYTYTHFIPYTYMWVPAGNNLCPDTVWIVPSTRTLWTWRFEITKTVHFLEHEIYNFTSTSTMHGRKRNLSLLDWSRTLEKPYRISNKR